MSVLTKVKKKSRHKLLTYQLHNRPVAGLHTMRWLVAGGLLCLVYLLGWLVTTAHAGYAPLFWLFAFSMSYKVLWMVHEWVHYVQVKVPVPPAKPARQFTVDMLTTSCPGEPRAMIIRTLEAMQAVRYPHTSYLCDEGNDPVLRQACEHLGVIHVTRKIKVNAKAGNINNALRQATGDLCVVLDPDHVPTPDFLDQVTAYFEDDQVGFVQVVQAYGNQNESLVAQGAAEQTYHFYGPLMMAMNAYGTVQAIGANCTFRRTALDSIGGHAPGLTEDMHTAMLLHAAGWKSAYVPKVVSRGLVPSSLAAFYAQQLKWSRGAFDLLFRVYPKVCSRFTWAQRLHYFFLPLYFLSGIVTLIDLSLPLFSLGLSQFPLLVNLSELALHVLPLLAMFLLIRYQAQRWLREPGEGGMHLAGGILQLGTWWVYTLGLLYAIVGVRVPYLPTPKEGRWNNEWRLAIPNLLLAALLLVACKYGRVVAYGSYTNTMVAIALLNVGFLLAAVAMGQHQVIRNFVQDMATSPYRWLILRLHRWQVGLIQALVPLVQQFGGSIAFVTLLGLGTFYAFRSEKLAQIPTEWVKNGANSVHLGHSVEPTIPTLASFTIGELFSTSSTSEDYTISALAINPLLPLPSQVSSLAHQHQVVLLNWSSSAADTQKPHYWESLMHEISQVPGVVMLQPQFVAPTDIAYRQAWQQMVQAFEDKQIQNVTWVWTPETSDTQLQRFPGIKYTDWLASSLQTQAKMQRYSDLRKQLAGNLDMQRIPVLLLAASPKEKPTLLAARLTEQYPELRAIVFSSVPPLSLPTASIDH